MVYFSNAPETSNLFGSYIEQVQQVLAANHVQFGSPADFPAFTETLETDSQLRNDLASLARSFMGGEEHVSLRTVLSIIAIASGGPDVADSDSDMSQPVSVLVDFLISSGGGRPAGTEVPDSHQSDPINASPYQTELYHPTEPYQEEPQPYLPPPPSLNRDTSGHETPSDQTTSTQIRPSPLPDPVPYPVPDPLSEPVQEPVNDTADLSPLEAAPRLPNLDPLPHSDTGNSLVESLARLELNSLQVKHYLDSIDERIGRIEPRLDHLPTPGPPATPPQFAHTPEARYSSVLISEPFPDPPPDEPPPPAPIQTQAAMPPDSLSHHEPPPRQSPLQAPSRDTRSKIAIPVTAAATALLVSLFYWGFSRNKSSITIQPVPAPIVENEAAASPNPVPAPGLTTSDPFTVTAPPTHSPAATAPTHSPGTDARAFNRSTQIRRSVPPPPPADTKYSSTAPGDSARILLPKPSAASLANSDDSTYPATLAEPVNVSAHIMAANVLLAPQPSYPKLASLTRMQGEVVMKAIISKEGTIEDVHVINGHRLLRSAATHAVRNWRYRPYLINGHPVEVATTVSVDFKLPQ